MGRLLLAMVALALSRWAAVADVHLVEEVVNSGIGPQKAGARKTVKRVYIKGARQRVDTQVEASQAVARQLRAQGQRLRESTILQLDSARVYAIDPVQSVYSRAPLPAPKPASRLPTGPGPAARPDTADDPNREISFRTRVLGDTLRLQGLLCKRVAAEMRVRHYVPGTRTVARENRYLYQAWMAEDFPGYGEIMEFRRLQRQKTSFPFLLGGGLEQIRDAVDDGDRLTAEIESLDGFPMQSELRVTVRTKAGTKPVLTLSRRVVSLAYSPLPDSLFGVTASLRPLEE